LWQLVFRRQPISVCSGLSLRGSGTRTPQLLQLQHNIRGEDSEGIADPYHGFGNDRVIIPAAQPEYYPHFEKDESDGKAAGHPLAVLLHFPGADKSERNHGGQNPGGGLHARRDAEGSRAAHPLLEVLDV
jgi:hypothetical protein